MTLAFLAGQLEYMAERGYDVHVVSAPGEDLHRFAALYGATPHPVPMTRRITPLRDLASVFELARLLRRLRPTIVHAHTPKGGLAGMLAGALARVPVRVYHLRGQARSEDGRRARILRATDRIACRLAHRIFAVSRSLQRAAIEDRFGDPDKIRILESGSGNGVDAEARFDPRRDGGARPATRARLGIPLDAPVVGFLGRLSGDKGIIELAEAWRILRERFPSAHLMLVGSPDEADPIPAGILEGLTSDPRVHATGHDWNTPPLYAAMDVVALPTYREGFPNVLLEAASMELPVVATRIPGCEEAVVEGVTGTLVPVRDAEGLSSALAMYLADPALGRRHGRAGRERALREFRPQAIWQALYAEYEQLVATRMGRK